MDFFLGIRGARHGFVMLCCDTAATQQIITIKHDEDKLLALDTRTVMALSGEKSERGTEGLRRERAWGGLPCMARPRGGGLRGSAGGACGCGRHRHGCDAWETVSGIEKKNDRRASPHGLLPTYPPTPP
jgi:hypothetical protein